VGEVILGLQASEAQARGLYAYESPTDALSSRFGGAFHGGWSGIPCRDFSGRAGVAFQLDGTYRRNWLELVFFGRPNVMGDPAAGPGGTMPPARILLQDRRRLREVGVIALSGAERWETFTFALPGEVRLGDTVKVIVDALESYVSPETHYGLRWHSARIYGEGPRPRRSGGEEDPDPEVLLLMAPPWSMSMPPIAPACLAAYLRQHGVATEVLDLNAKLFNLVAPDWRAFWEPDDGYKWMEADPGQARAERLLELSARYLRWIERLAPRVIGFSFNKINYHPTMATARELRRRLPEATLVIGGQGLYDSSDGNLERIQQLFDYLVLGEGEASLLELVRGEPDHPAIIDTRQRTISRETALQHQRGVRRLAELPLFSLDAFDLSNYTTFNLPGISSRGCFNRCVYCLDRKTCVSYRHYGADHVVAQLRRLKEEHGADFIYFNDLLVNGHLRRLEETCDALIEADLGLNWTSFAMIRPEMTDELLDKLLRAGCANLTYGVESASAKVLEAMRKSYGPAEVEDVLRRTRAAGIGCSLNLIFGFPGETWDDFLETVEFIVERKELFDHIGSITDTLLIPNTDMFFEREAFGIEQLSDDPRDWRAGDSDHAQRMRRCQYALDRFQEAGIEMVQPTGKRG
jgi:hypothetical protein